VNLAVAAEMLSGERSSAISVGIPRIDGHALLTDFDLEMIQHQPTIIAGHKKAPTPRGKLPKFSFTAVKGFGIAGPKTTRGSRTSALSQFETRGSRTSALSQFEVAVPLEQQGIRTPKMSRLPATGPSAAPKSASRSAVSAAPSAADKGPEDEFSKFVTRVLAMGRTQHIHLGRVNYEAMCEIVKDLLIITTDVPQRTRQILWEKSQGHPLLIVEVTRAMVQSGWISVSNGECFESEDLLFKRTEDLKLPSSVTSIASARIDHLNLRQQMVLKVCSVFDDVFDVADLTNLCASAAFLKVGAEDSVKNTVAKELRVLCDAGLVTKTSTETPDGVVQLTFQVSHRQVKDAAYELLPFRLRKTLHAFLAKGLCASGASDRVIAHHFMKAEEWADTLTYMERTCMHDLKFVKAYSAASLGFLELLHIIQLHPSARALVDDERIGTWHLGLAVAQHELGNRAAAEAQYQLAKTMLTSSLVRFRNGQPVLGFETCLQLVHMLLPQVSVCVCVSVSVCDACSVVCGVRMLCAVCECTRIHSPRACARVHYTPRYCRRSSGPRHAARCGTRRTASSCSCTAARHR
jgi:hypothetical protein